MKYARQIPAVLCAAFSLALAVATSAAPSPTPSPTVAPAVTPPTPTPTPTLSPLEQAQADLAAAKDQITSLSEALKDVMAQRNKAQSERDNFEVQVAIDQGIIKGLKDQLAAKK